MSEPSGFVTLLLEQSREETKLYVAELAKKFEDKKYCKINV